MQQSILLDVNFQSRSILVIRVHNKIKLKDFWTLNVQYDKSLLLNLVKYSNFIMSVCKTSNTRVCSIWDRDATSRSRKSGKLTQKSGKLRKQKTEKAEKKRKLISSRIFSIYEDFERFSYLQHSAFILTKLQNIKYC